MLQPVSIEQGGDSGLLPDLTYYDFSNAQLYKSRETEPLRAEQLVADEVLEQPWGVQELKEGDWVVFKPSVSKGIKRSGVRREAFDATYDSVDEGLFIKRAFIRAVKINYAFQFVGIDSEQPETVGAGKYFALNLDRDRHTILVGGRRDILFYKEKDIEKNYQAI